MKKLLITLLIIGSFFELKAQKIERDITYIGNLFTIEIDDDNNLLDINVNNISNEGKGKKIKLNASITESQFAKELQKVFDEFTEVYSFKSLAIDNLKISKEDYNSYIDNKETKTDLLYKDFSLKKDSLVERFK